MNRRTFLQGLPAVPAALALWPSVEDRAASIKEGVFGGVRTVRVRDGAQEVDVHIKIRETGLF